MHFWPPECILIKKSGGQRGGRAGKYDNGMMACGKDGVPKARAPADSGATLALQQGLALAGAILKGEFTNDSNVLIAEHSQKFAFQKMLSNVNTCSLI